MARAVCTLIKKHKYRNSQMNNEKAADEIEIVSFVIIDPLTLLLHYKEWNEEHTSTEHTPTDRGRVRL